MSRYTDRQDDHSDDEEDVVVYGTPLPALEDDEAAPKKASLDLTVRDEQGRRRFHGAFTGGFSAGYFNSVGSKEGWVPAQFVSSRKSKWGKDLLKDRPEDYMDDEDFNAHGIAPKRVHTTDKFTSSTSSRELGSFAGFRDAACDLVDFLRETVAPAKVSVGIKMLKYLKGTSKILQKQLQSSRSKDENDEPKSKKQKIYGCSLPPGMSLSFDLDDDESDEEQSARESEKEPAIHPYKLPYEVKKNRHGLGYQGMLDPNNFLPSKDASSLSLTASISGRKLKISGDAFGTGVLEEENDFDDVNLYETDDLSKYDFELQSGRESRGKKSKKQVTLSDKSNLTDLFQLSRSSDEKFNYSGKYKVPEIPRNWKPRGPFTPLSSVSASLVTSSTAASDNNSHKGVQEHTSDESKRRHRDLYSLPHHQQSDDEARSGHERNLVKEKTTGPVRKSRWDQQKLSPSVTKNNVQSAPGQSEQRNEYEGHRKHRKSEVGSERDDDRHHHHRHEYPRSYSPSQDDHKLHRQSPGKDAHEEGGEEKIAHAAGDTRTTATTSATDHRSSFNLHAKMASTSHVSSSGATSELLMGRCTSTVSAGKNTGRRQVKAVMDAKVRSVILGDGLNVGVKSQSVKKTREEGEDNDRKNDGNPGTSDSSSYQCDSPSKLRENVHVARSHLHPVMQVQQTNMTCTSSDSKQKQPQSGEEQKQHQLEQSSSPSPSSSSSLREEEKGENRCRTGDRSTTFTAPRKTTLSGFFASKFVHSSSASSTSVIESSDVNLEPGLTMSTDLTVKLDKSKNRPDDLRRTPEKETLALIGSKRRSYNQWMPHKILCKRFNVPYPGSSSHR